MSEKNALGISETNKENRPEYSATGRICSEETNGTYSVRVHYPLEEVMSGIESSRLVCVADELTSLKNTNSTPVNLELATVNTIPCTSGSADREARKRRHTPSSSSSSSLEQLEDSQHEQDEYGIIWPNEGDSMRVFSPGYIW